ncbi:MAG: hypothetical protein FRX49_12221 [Trebouxia sp. A1-2]|nr:MAG: hypothetical protein FRX49_12221 [Trebouxia sp. A1-2]
MGRGVPGPLRLPVGRPAGKGVPALAAAFRFRERVAFCAMPRPSWSRAGTLAILKAGPAIWYKRRKGAFTLTSGSADMNVIFLIQPDGGAANVTPAPGEAQPSQRKRCPDASSALGYVQLCLLQLRRVPTPDSLQAIET